LSTTILQGKENNIVLLGKLGNNISLLFVAQILMMMRIGRYLARNIILLL